MSSSRRSILVRSRVALLLALTFVSVLLSDPALAIPANTEAPRLLVQPDGSTVTARLLGDELAHWYETEDGYTLSRAPEGYWTYATQDMEGRLISSGVVPGSGMPPEPRHLRPGDATLLTRRQARGALRTVGDPTGTHQIVIIMVEFADTPTGQGSQGPHDGDYFTDPTTGHVFGSDQGKLHDYYDEVSYGQLDLQGIVANDQWHLSAQNGIYYGEDCSPGQPCQPEYGPPEGTDNCNVCIYELAREAIQLADASGFDFAPYDTDEDGVIDHVMIVHAGLNQAAYGGGPDDIWSHWWAIPGGEPVDGKTVEHYVMLAEWDAMSIFAHEFAHDLGAPDLYDHDGDSDPVGRWCNMGYNVEHERPPHLCGLLKIDIDADFSNGMTGWVAPDTLGADSTYHVLRLDENAIGSIHVTMAFSGAERFIVENRQRDGFYDYSVPEAGILITHIDMDMPNGDGRFNDGPPGNSYHGAWIERPANLASPDGAAFSADDGETEFTQTTIPNTNANGGVGTGRKFQSIGSEGDDMTFDFRPGPTVVSGTTTGNTIWDAAGSPYVVDQNVTVAGGDTLTIESGVIVKFKDDRSLFVLGTILAQGAPGDSIVFTSYHDDEYGGDTNQNGPSSGTRGDWCLILLNAADAYGSFSYCRVRYAGAYYNYAYHDYLHHALSVIGTNATLSLDHCLVDETYGYSANYRSPYAVRSRNGTHLRMEHCTIVNNDRVGVYANGTFWLSESTISDNGSTAIYASGDSAYVGHTRSARNGGNGLELAGTNCTVFADTLEDNGAIGLYCAQAMLEFRDNLITGNGSFACHVPVPFVDQTWTANTLGPNGRGNAIGVSAGAITQSTQWIDEHPYAVFGDITVPDNLTLTLEAGSILKFDAQRSLITHGVLIAEGAETDSIIFTSYKDDEYGGDTNGDGPSNGSRGDWSVLLFSSADAGCSLSYSRIRYAGYSYYLAQYDYLNSAITLHGQDTALTLTNSIVEETYAYNYSYRHPYAIESREGTTLEMSRCIVRNNDYVGVRSLGALSISHCAFANNLNLGVHASGNGASITHSRFEGNGAQGLYSSGAMCTIVADTVLANANHGLQLTQDPAQFEDCYGADNAQCEFVVPVTSLPLCWTQNQAQLGHEIGMHGGTLPSSTTWIDDHPLAILETVTVPHDLLLTLEAGSILKLASQAGLVINGQFVASGTAADSITITSYKDDAYGGDTNGNGPSSGTPGHWMSLSFAGTNPGSIMEYCRVRYGGYRRYENPNYYQNAIHLSGAGAELAISNSIIESTGREYTSYSSEAIRVRPGATSHISHCTAQHNVWDGFLISEPTTTLTGCLAASNERFGYFVHPNLAGEAARDDSSHANGYGNCIAVLDGTITQDDSWPDDYTFLVNGDIIIDPGATVIMEKGAVIKFNGNRSLDVLGGLVTQGDAVDKVVFTSLKDDAYGGDTNADGINSQPAPGDWGQIHFDGANPASRLGWTVVAYGGYNNAAAIEINDCALSFAEVIAKYALDRGIKVGSAGELEILHSDIYGNGFGLENLNTAVDVDARTCWWGHPSGPSGVGPGTGDAVSDHVLYDPWLDRSIDNPWVALTSPSEEGNYTDVLIIDLDSDPLLDLIATTEESGIETYLRTGFEEWELQTPLIPSGQYLALDGGDFNDDDIDDFLTCGPSGIRCFAGDGAGNPVEVNAPLVGLVCSDAIFGYVDHDQYLDVVGCSGNNGGIWVFFGDGQGNWIAGVRPTETGSFHRVATVDLNNDTWIDIIATSAEFHGVRIWYGSEELTWTEAGPIEDGNAFFGLAVGDIDREGDYDLAVGSNQSSIGIQIFLNDGEGGWDPAPGPTTAGLYNDLILEDLNGDMRLDLVAASQGGGIHVWVGTSSGFWNYWYHPATEHIYRGICVEDFTLNGSPDLAGASTPHGISLWDNLTPGEYQEYFATNPDQLEFGQVAVSKCAHESFQLENVSADTLRNVVVYTTNPVFEVSLGGREVGPFDMEPGEVQTIEVAYCPVDSVAENEIVIIHSTQAVTHVRVTGEGVPFIPPLWTMNLQVANAVADSANSRTLTFGGGIGATDSLDVGAGEICLPPLPPIGVFDARFQIAGCEGSLVNIHDYYLEQDQFIFQWQVGAGGYPLTVSWDPGTLPEGTYLISDLMGGALVDTLNMSEATEVVIPDEISDPGLLAITTYRQSSFVFHLDIGWHLLSLPIATESEALVDLFPEAISAFTWAEGYLQVTELGVGIGYWVDMADSAVVTHQGERVEEVVRVLPEGWSLVGTIHDSLAVAEIQQDPPGCLVSVFGFSPHYGYQLATVLAPRQGYWFDMNQLGEVTISQPYGDSGGDVPSPSASVEQFRWTLPVELAAASQPEQPREVTIGFATGATTGLDPSLGERLAPPWPPTTLLETRLLVEEVGEMYLDLRPAAVGEHQFDLAWQPGSCGYPLHLRWNPELIPEAWHLILRDNLDGSFIGPLDMAELDELVIGEELAFLTGVQIRAGLSAAGLPEDPTVTDFALWQNAPNPVHSSTVITYALPQASCVDLVIYDVAGRTVQVLARGDRPAGRHVVRWNGRRESGADAGAGVYFYRLRAGDYVAERKLLLVR